MSDWGNYVRKFYSLSREEQQAEWEKLTPGQMEHFEAARISAAQPPADLFQPIANVARKQKVAVIGCVLVLVVGVLAIGALSFLVILGKHREEARAREAAQRKVEQAAEQRRQTIAYFQESETAILEEVNDLVTGGQFEEAVALAEKYLLAENSNLATLHARAVAELEAAERRKMIEEILVKVKQVPAADAVKNRDLYLKLAELDPDESLYKERLRFYSRRVDEQVERAHREREQYLKERAREEKERQSRIARFGEAPVASSWDGSYPAVKRYLRQVANDPDSIKIAGCTKVYHTDKGWLVGCDYRGRNAFGGLVKQSNWFTIVRGKVKEMHDASAYKP